MISNGSGGFRSYQKIHSFLSFDRPALLAVNLYY